MRELPATFEATYTAIWMPHKRTPDLRISLTWNLTFRGPGVLQKALKGPFLWFHGNVDRVLSTFTLLGTLEK